MDADLFEELERRVTSLMHTMNELRLENGRLKQENDRLSKERGGIKSRIDSILQRLEGV